MRMSEHNAGEPLHDLNEQLQRLRPNRTFTGPRGTNSLRRWNESGDYVIADFRERYRVILE